MDMIVKETTTRTAATADGMREDSGKRYGDGGPVFIPTRRPSPLARTLLASAGGGRVSACDELWYAGRPSA